MKLLASGQLATAGPSVPGDRDLTSSWYQLVPSGFDWDSRGITRACDIPQLGSFLVSEFRLKNVSGLGIPQGGKCCDHTVRGVFIDVCRFSG